MKSVRSGLAPRFLPLAGLLIIGLLLGSVSCRKKASPAPEPATPAQTPAATAPAKPAEDKVVATVNGDPVMQSQVQQRIEDEFRPLLNKYAAQSPQLAQQQENRLRQALVEALVVENLLNAEAKKANIPEVTDQELAAEMTKQLAAMDPPMTLEQYRKLLEEQGRDFETTKRSHARDLRYERLLESKFPEACTTTEAEAKKYYDDNIAEFQVPEQVRASHILIRPADPNTDPNQAKAQAKAKAEEVLKKVKDGGDFATLAKENSDCPSKTEGGDLGLFTRDKMVKPFADAAFAMKVGDTSDLVETQFGYHIIKVTEHHDPNQIAFEKAQADIINQLTRQKKQEAARTYVESLRQNAKIVYPSSPAAPATPTAPAPSIAPAPQAQPAAPAAEVSPATPKPQPSQPVTTAPADANDKK